MNLRSSLKSSWFWFALLISAAIGYAISRSRTRALVVTNGRLLPVVRSDAASGEVFARSPTAAQTKDRAIYRKPPPLRFNGRRLLLVGGIALLALVVFLLIDPQAMAGGWLLAVVFCSSISIGSLAAMMVHALTGGYWGLRFNAVFMPTAAAVPLVALLLVPVFVVPGAFFAWTVGSGRVPPDVSQYFLNVPFFIARSLIALLGWTVLAYALPRLAGWAAVVVAAIGLAFHGLVIGVIGVDWVLSLQPVFMSTSFGASLAITQLAAALAWALIVSPVRTDDTSVADLGGLLLATLLGVTYMNFMALLIIWYGDLPRRVFWFVARDHWTWTLIAALAFVFGSIIPIFALFLARVRSSLRALRIVSVSVLTGIAIYDAYLIAPPFGVLALGAGALAIIAAGALLMAFAALPFSRAGYIRWRVADDG